MQQYHWGEVTTKHGLAPPAALSEGNAMEGVTGRPHSAAVGQAFQTGLDLTTCSIVLEIATSLSKAIIWLGCRQCALLICSAAQQGSMIRLSHGICPDAVHQAQFHHVLPSQRVPACSQEGLPALHSACWIIRALMLSILSHHNAGFPLLRELM